MLRKLSVQGCPHVRTCHSQTPGKKRVVVTGMGLVSCLGIGCDLIWQRLIQGDSGIGKLHEPEYEGIPCRIAGRVPRGSEPGELELEKFVSKAEQRSMSLASCYAMVAAHEALTQAQWRPQEETSKCRTGVAVGMGMPGLEDIVDTGRTLAEKGYKRVNPFFIPRILINLGAGHISMKYGFKGVNHAVSTACTTGVHAIGDGVRFIRDDYADVMVCGGAEASVLPVGMAGFARMRALATSYNDRPAEASRPFDAKREGFVMSEGAGIVVLESLEHAQTRGATILGEVLGYGLSGDANHITAPSEDGDGAYRCMAGALSDAGITPEQVSYINAHATSTPLGDAAESRAITRLFAGHSHQVAVSSTKGSVGHLLGAAGSVEAIFTLLACRTGVLPPTLNCHQPDGEFDLNYVPLKAQAWPTDSHRRIALTNSFGFGGTNASLCLAADSSS